MPRVYYGQRLLIVGRPMSALLASNVTTMELMARIELMEASEFLENVASLSE